MNSIPEINNTQNIKQHFTKTVTTQQCNKALNRLEIWVAKEKEEEIIRENIVKKQANKDSGQFKNYKYYKINLY